jgi:hypothetical protein
LDELRAEFSRLRSYGEGGQIEAARKIAARYGIDWGSVPDSVKKRIVDEVMEGTGKPRKEGRYLFENIPAEIADDPEKLREWAEREGVMLDPARRAAEPMVEPAQEGTDLIGADPEFAKGSENRSVTQALRLLRIRAAAREVSKADLDAASKRISEAEDPLRELDAVLREWDERKRD